MVHVAGELFPGLAQGFMVRPARHIQRFAAVVFPVAQVADLVFASCAQGQVAAAGAGLQALDVRADGVVTQPGFTQRNDTKAVNDLELVPTTAGGDTFQLVFKGRKVAASQVNVQTSEGWYRTLTPSQDGTVSFKPYFPGLYVLEVTARVDNGSVTLDGKKYTDVRHTTTLSFEVKP